MLELVGVPLFDLLVLPRREEKMSLGDKLEEHDAAGGGDEVRAGGSEAPPRRWDSPVVVSEHGAVAVAEVQTPDLHVSVGGAGGDERAVLVDTRRTDAATSVTSLHFQRSQQLIVIDYIDYCRSLIKTKR